MAIPPPGSGIPLGTHCPRCDYNIAGAPFGRCPECGCKLGIEDIAYDVGPRRTFIRETRKRLMRLGIFYTLVIGAWMATAAARTNFTTNEVVIGMVALLAVVVNRCAAEGWWLIRPKRLRQLHAAIWMRLAWLLFIPWCVPILASWMFLLNRSEFEIIVLFVIGLLGLVGVLCPMIFIAMVDAQLAQWRSDQNVPTGVKLAGAVVAMFIVYGGTIIVAATTGVFG